MKITKGSYVAMKGVRTNGLYVLLGKTIIEPFTVATVAIDSSDQTMLWQGG